MSKLLKASGINSKRQVEFEQVIYKEIHIMYTEMHPIILKAAADRLLLLMRTGSLTRDKFKEMVEKYEKER